MARARRSAQRFRRRRDGCRRRSPAPTSSAGSPRWRYQVSSSPMSAAASVPDGARLNVGSGPVVAPEWINIDGSWQARLAGHRWLTPLVSATLGVDVGHWPRGIRYRDIRRGLGYADRLVAIVYTSQHLEHLDRD